MAKKIILQVSILLTLQLEERRRREAQACHLARANHGLRRVGRAYVP